MDSPDMGIRITSTQGYDSFESFVSVLFIQLAHSGV